MISEEAQYEHIAAVTLDRISRARDAFKLFLQLFSAIVGGSFWLRSQGAFLPAKRLTYVFASDALVWLVIIVTSITIYEALRSWWDHRVALAKFQSAGVPIPAPRFRALRADIAIATFMLIGGAIFTILNPFASL